MIDTHVTATVNKELEESEALAWSFAEALSHVFDLPKALEPLTKFELRVSAGEVRVTADAMVLALAFHSATVRNLDAEPGKVDRPRDDRAPTP